MLLIDFRKPVAKWRTRWIVTAALIVGTNPIGLLFLNFWDIYYRVGLFTVTLPYILVTLWCSQYRDFRAAFSIITGLFVGCIGTANEMLATLLLQHSKYCEYYSFAARLQAVTELVSRGDRAAALDFLDAAQKRLDEQKEIRWCRPPVLDAVFSPYFDQARRQGIPVESRISLPDVLPVDEGELAIVIANALENAIHANLKLAQEQRKIRCKMVGAPSVMLELSNPCGTQVAFDDRGLPLAQNAGHGLGVQSISAFCRKTGAICQFDLTGGWFRFQLVL